MKKQLLLGILAINFVTIAIDKETNKSEIRKNQTLKNLLDLAIENIDINSFSQIIYTESVKKLKKDGILRQSCFRYAFLNISEWKIDEIYKKGKLRDLLSMAEDLVERDPSQITPEIRADIDNQIMNYCSSLKYTPQDLRLNYYSHKFEPSEEAKKNIHSFYIPQCGYFLQLKEAIDTGTAKAENPCVCCEIPDLFEPKSTF